jgi:hypothetical protein
MTNSLGSLFAGKNALVLIIALVVVAAVIGTTGLPFAVISVSQVSTTTNGEVWVSTFAATDASQTETLILKAVPITNSTGTYTPQKEISISFFPTNPTCTYPTALRDFPSILGINVGQYSYLNSPALAVPYQVKTSESGTILNFDGTLIGTSKTISTSGGCNIIITQLGSYQGKYTCPSPANTALVQVKDANGALVNRFTKSSLVDNRNSIYSGIAVTCGLLGSPLNIANCINVEENKAFYADTTFTNSFDPFPQITSSSVIGKLPNRASSPSFTITTNANCYRPIYSPPVISEPQILELSDISGYSGTTQSAVLTVKNAGAAQADYTIETRSPDNSVSVLTAFDSKTIAAGQTSGVVLRFNLGNFASEKTGTIIVKMCSSSQVAVKCVEKTFSNIAIKPIPVSPITGLPAPLPTATPVPAGVIDCSSITNSVVVQGTCDCPAANPYRVTDSNNRLVACGKSGGIDPFVVGLLVVGGIVLLIVSLLSQRGGKGKGGSGLPSVGFLQPLIMPLIVGAIAWYVSASFLAGINIPFIGQPFLGLAPVIGLAAFLFTLLFRPVAPVININK